MFKNFLKIVTSFLAMGIAVNGYANVIISIDNTGANDPVNTAHPRVWNFGVTEAGAAYFQKNGITFDTAIFDAKVFQNTTEPIVFTLYSGLGGKVAGNTVLASVSKPASDFNQQYTGGASVFKITPEVFTMGYYSVTLTTTAPDKTNQEYFLKDGTLSLLTKTASGTYSTLASNYWLKDNSVGNATSTFNGTGSLTDNGGGAVIGVAPEPSTVLALIAITGVSFGGSFLRRMKKSA
jgi:hypothetical protein